MARHNSTVSLEITANNSSQRAFDQAQQSLRRIETQSTRTGAASRSMGARMVASGRAMLAAINPITASMAAVASSFALGGVALGKFLKVSEEIQIIENEISGLGLSVEVSNEKILEFGIAIGSLSDGRQIIKRLVASGPAIAQFGDKIIELAGTFDNLAKTTEFSATNQARSFGRAMFDSVKPVELSARALTRLSERLDLFSKVQIKTITEMARSGKAMEANSLVADRLNEVYGDINVEDVGAKFRTLGAEMDALWESIGSGVAENIGPAIKQLTLLSEIVRGFLGNDDDASRRDIEIEYRVNIDSLRDELASVEATIAKKPVTFASKLAFGLAGVSDSLVGTDFVDTSIDKQVVERKRLLEEISKLNADFQKDMTDALKIINPIDDTSVEETKSEVADKLAIIKVEQDKRLGIIAKAKAEELAMEKAKQKLIEEAQAKSIVQEIARQKLLANASERDAASKQLELENEARRLESKLKGLEEIAAAEKSNFDFAKEANDVQLRMYSELGQSISTNIVDQMFEGGSATERLANIGANLVKSIISGLIDVGVQQGINFLIGQTSLAASTSAQVASNIAIASAATPAALAVNVASFGGAAVASTATLLPSIAAGKAAFVASGSFHAGTPSVPKTGSYILEKNERIVKQAENQQLGNFLNRQERQGSTTNHNGNSTVNVSLSATDTTGLDKLVSRITDKLTAAVSKSQRHNRTRYQREL